MVQKRPAKPKQPTPKSNPRLTRKPAQRLAPKRKSRPRRAHRRRVWLYIAIACLLLLVGGLFLFRHQIAVRLGWTDGPKKHAPFDPAPKNLDGAVYFGDMSNQLPNGTGLMQLDDGSIWSGSWVDGQRDGVMRYSDSKGQSSFSLWSNGELVKALEMPPSSYLDQPCRYGIDVSRYQPEYWGSMLICTHPDGTISHDHQSQHWRPVEFVIIKASGQRGVADPLYQYHSSMADMLCIPQGAYHVFSSKVDIEQQVQAYLNEVSDVKLAFPPVLDIEGSTSEISASEFREIEPLCLQWLRRIEAETGTRPIIYCCLDFYLAYGTGSALSAYDFWIANYGRAEFPSGCRMRQISETGRIAGWSSYVDIDVLILPPNDPE